MLQTRVKGKKSTAQPDVTAWLMGRPIPDALPRCTSFHAPRIGREATTTLVSTVVVVDERKKLARVREPAVGKYSLGYHAGERQHRKTAVGDLLELHARLVVTASKARKTSGRSGGGRGVSAQNVSIHAYPPQRMCDVCVNEGVVDMCPCPYRFPFSGRYASRFWSF